MCTLSWYKSEGDYQIFFNRDEQRTRPLALKPKFHADLEALFPVDPQGSGTWIALHKSGTTFALLNNYQASKNFKPQGDLLSRGLLIPELISRLKIDQDFNVGTELKTIPFQNMSPFQLAHFPLSKEPELWIWDGLEIRSIPLPKLIISSGVQLAEVTHSRARIFKETPHTIEGRYQFHMGHLPMKNEFSVCMHRSDAHSVSFSHIDTNSKQLHYKASSPCNQEVQIEKFIFE